MAPSPVMWGAAMISKLITGKSIRGLLRYIFRERENLKGVEFLESNLVGYNLDLLSRQFVQIRMQKPELTTPVTHLVVSFDPRDEGKLTPEMKREVVHRQLRTLGYLGSERGDCPYVVVRHADKRHDHLHVAISQVSFQGVRIDRSNDQYKANELDRKLESEWGLRQCRSHKIKVARRKEIERLDLPEAGQYQIPAPGTLPNPGEISQHEWLRQIIGPVV